MRDYIKREDAQKVIDRRMNDEIFETDMTHCLEMIPSADVVEVVRCKDCKYWQPHTQRGFDEDNGEYHNYCGYHMPDDEWYTEHWGEGDYCSYGKRKEADHEHE